MRLEEAIRLKVLAMAIYNLANSEIVAHAAKGKSRDDEGRMTPAQAKTKEHWHVRDVDGLRPEPYGSPAAARGAVMIARGSMMSCGTKGPGLRVQKIGLRGACPCRAESSVAAESAGDGRIIPQPGNRGRNVRQVATDSVSSDRKVQTPEERGCRREKKAVHPTSAGAATSAVPSLQPSDDPSVAPATTTYGHAEIAYLNRISQGGYEG